MSNKTIIILAAVLCLIIGGIAGTRWYESRARARLPDTPLKKAFMSMDFDQVERFKIVRGDTHTALTRDSSSREWQVGEKKADAEKVYAAWEAMRTVSFTGPVSKMEENFEKLGVGNDGMKVELPDAVFFLGASGPTYNSNYIRLDGSNDTYLSDKNLTAYFGADVDFWQSRTVADIDPAQVKKLVYQQGGKDKKTYLNEEGAWRMLISATSTTTEDGLMKGILDRLHPLTASGFVNDEKDIQTFEKGQSKGTVLSVFGMDDAVRARIALVKQENEWWARAEGDGQIYRLPQYTVDALKVE